MKQSRAGQKADGATVLSYNAAEFCSHSFVPRYKTLTGPKFTSSKTPDTQQGLGWLKTGVCAASAASPEGGEFQLAVAIPCRAIMASPGVGGETLRRRHRDCWDSWRQRFYNFYFYCGCETALQSRQVPAAPFYVYGGSEWNFETVLSKADLHKITSGGGFQKKSSKSIIKTKVFKYEPVL